MTDPTARPMRCAVYPPEMRIVVAIHDWGSGASALTEPVVQRLGTKDTKLHCRSAIAAAQRFQRFAERCQKTCASYGREGGLNLTAGKKFEEWVRRLMPRDRLVCRGTHR
jgi:hypothetical protein